MNIHEYQAKALLKTYGVPLAEGVAVSSLEQVATACANLPGSSWAVKSQIHAGGRGKGHFKDAVDKSGGVRIAQSLTDAQAIAQNMLGQTLITHQTGPAGKIVRTLYIEAGVQIARELYLSMSPERRSGQIALIVSAEGGTDIEHVAAVAPDKIHTLLIDPEMGVTDALCQSLCAALSLEGEALTKQASTLVRNLFQAFIEKDMALLEINPLIVSVSGNIQVLDAKITFDSNALYRHPDIESLRDAHEEDAKEQDAQKWDLAYIALDGNIGCMVNGAGLAMATMDMIKLYGATPANFCDVGGGASAEKVEAALRIILEDPNVKGILVNIFGGIMRCDVIAEGILQAVKNTPLPVPLIVRLEGTNVEQGKAAIAQSGLDIITASDLDDAAQKIVAAIQ